MYLQIRVYVFDTKTGEPHMSKVEIEGNALLRMEKEFISMRSYLEQIISLQKEMMQRLDRGEKATEEADNGSSGLSVAVLLRLPDHLRKTMVALSKLVEGRADEVASITGRARAIESGYLNQLVRLGYVKKIRKKHQIYFGINGEA
jgi:Zn-dependent M32 family carboxypeptidase